MKIILIMLTILLLLSGCTFAGDKRLTDFDIRCNDCKVDYSKNRTVRDNDLQIKGL